ncbi:unnamed protein product [Clonostachys rhizophaga]|uniref:Myb-like DNA-binding domain-containing protein n=1 Tax=Clonostachys rhizophaga TaxID=160324 RepID=A0A9N9VAE5_9HYPO|nr:unnamed protein product [Clonostachys rhizophaga]
MSPNSDNAMARFLFAILKQKNLKDIDWNQVANDPVLLQPITNGHAARMRYSRFRATVSGTGTQKRNRIDSKARVTKPKGGRSGSVKSESCEGDIKQERSPPHHAPMSHYSPTPTTSPYLADNLSTRFLTPCSDDMANGFLVNPAAMESINHQHAPKYASPLDFINCPPQPYSPEMSVLDDAFDMSSLSADSARQSLGDHSPLWNDNLPF